MNEKIRYLIGGAALFSALALGLVTAVGGLAVGGEGHERSERTGRQAAQADPVYLAECGACHVAYPPGMLPRASWERLMDGLADHFGDNAELAAESAARLRAYLAAQGGKDEGAATLRISERPWFLRKHDELPASLPAQEPRIGSWARCEACHTRAVQGSYNEHEVNIPGKGKWED
jgi:hypothetical protein